MKFIIKPMRHNAKTLSLLDEWEERTQAVVVALPRMVAEDTLADIQTNAPRGIAGYPDMLKVMAIPMRDWAIFGIIPEGSFGSQRLESIDSQRTVLYVQPRIIRGESSPAAVVLERSNPWTMDSLPYEPKKREATLMSRRVSEYEAKIIERRRAQERPGIERELQELGVQLRKKGKVLLERRVTRDLAWEILRYEFGIPPVRGKAHWRPAVGKYKQFAENRLKKNLLDWVADPDNVEWKRGDTLPDVKVSVIADLQRFQEIIMTGRVGGR